MSEPTAAEVVAFLNGEGQIKSAWFGDKPADERGAFWWRKYLAVLTPPATDAAEMRERVARIIDPEWFETVGGQHVLDNYPGQHKAYQGKAFTKADRILALHRELFAGSQPSLEPKPQGFPDA